VQRLANKKHELFQEDPVHRSLHLKQVGEVWTADTDLCDVFALDEQTNLYALTLGDRFVNRVIEYSHHSQE